MYIRHVQYREGTLKQTRVQQHITNNTENISLSIGRNTTLLQIMYILWANVKCMKQKLVRI